MGYPKTGIDTLILPAKEILNSHGFKTFESCQGEEGNGSYLRRGKTEVKGAGDNTALDTNVIYHAAYVEKDQVVSAATMALSDVSMPLNAKNKGNINVPFQLILKFDSQAKCTITQPATASYTITGNGEFVTDGDMWGNEKRDVMRLQYQVDFGTTIHSFTDTIVARDRGVKFETFSPVVVN